VLCKAYFDILSSQTRSWHMPRFTICNFYGVENEKRWEIAMHCHLKLPVAPVVLGFSCEAHNAPAYKFSNSATVAHPLTQFQQNPTIGDSELLIIQQLFAAHFYAFADPISYKPLVGFSLNLQLRCNSDENELVRF